MKPAPGARTLGASVEATGRASDLCSGTARGRILVWLAEGARDVTWALCSLPREHWVTSPPRRPGDWPALRHARHLALRETHVTLPAVRAALNGESVSQSRAATLDFERADAAWDPVSADESADEIVRSFGGARFDLLQLLEAAPHSAGEQLDWFLLDAHQHELEHLAAMWKLALHWGEVPQPPNPGVPLHPADRLEESH